MEFKRTFHPVGQGAFFTERFYNESRDGYNSTIVYDCGSLSSRKMLYHEIEEFKKEQKDKSPHPFNLLFISHFDADHVNGLKKLIENEIADSTFIEELANIYNVSHNQIETLIRVYLIVKYPEEKAFISDCHADALYKEYSIEKSFIEYFVHEYIDFKKSHIIKKHGFKISRYTQIDENSVGGSYQYQFVDEFLRKQKKNKKREHIAVIVPFLFPHLIRILLPEMENELSEDTFEALRALFRSEIKVIGVDYNDFTDGYVDFYRDDIFKEQLYEDDVRTIKSFQKIKVCETEKGEECWYYMPYNTIVDKKQEEKFLVELYMALNRSSGKIGNWFRKSRGDLYDIKKNKCIEEIRCFLMNGISELFSDPDIIPDLIELLRHQYKKGCTGIKGVSVSAINVNSLNVLSFSSNDLKKNLLIDQSSFTYKLLAESSPEPFNGLIRRLAFMHQISDYNEYLSFFNFSCLYTGDCVMENHFFSWIDYLSKRVLRSTIGLLQIPHHGSQHNYNNQIQQTPIFSSFVNFKSGNQYTFAKEIDSLANSIPCFEVTSEKESRFQQIIKWKNLK